MNRRILLIQLFVIAASLAASIAAYPHLPPQIATHWGMQLQPNGYSGRSAIFLLGPVLLAAVLLFTRLAPWLSPVRFSVTGFQATWQRLMLLAFCLLSALFALTLGSALGLVSDVPRVIVTVICCFVILFGNLLSKVRPNFFVGVRTPWTLASEHVWIATHRVAAWLFVLSGVVGLLLVLAGRPQWSFLPLFCAVAFSALYSLVLYKRMAPGEHSPIKQ